MSTFDHLPDRPDGVRTVTVKTFARHLGVAPELVEGLVVAKKIRGYRAKGKTGAWIALVDGGELARFGGGE
ncbi:MAG TPA: hypothetical protein VNH17_17335 [Streptosporangiaceae bacterium]|nr:hypothetical protein [Streptosporangiaceae bacterium]